MVKQQHTVAQIVAFITAEGQQGKDQPPVGLWTPPHTQEAPRATEIERDVSVKGHKRNSLRGLVSWISACQYLAWTARNI